ncbi:MAG TPA: acetolactate synthase small subunit [Polyangiaceae bacterium]|jgi:acetolactate synthase-1/3 small subunit|nr:acetolactate synthase small subunit [Polyangiaceae bacterium]
MKGRHVLSVLVENRFGELARVVGLFAGRGFNIDSLAVNVTLDPAFSKIVLTTRGNDAIVEQIVKQLRKLIRVKKVVELSDDRAIERELCIVTVQAAGSAARQEVERVVSLTGARVIAFAQTAFTLEASAASQEIDQFLELLRPLGIRDMVRSAPIAIARPGIEVAAESVPPLGGVA